MFLGERIEKKATYPAIDAKLIDNSINLSVLYFIIINYMIC